jgi:hypothetical protein
MTYNDELIRQTRFASHVVGAHLKLHPIGYETVYIKGMHVDC